ncbi:metal-sensing transcriptional repressor [Candidatus Nomurabacteria bacterium]|nr:metal-sensing transcriptional repressor [Candidatus Kaiserbacteria bacterium]MCB9815215.1 metal-sensing transcriptional repressor [Candidatus Nomurabacteria bacterium]
MEIDRKQIVNHISRLEGQLSSVKAELMLEKPDCEKASKTLQSASRSFAGLREQFVETFLTTHFIDKSKIKDRTMFESLIALIKS